MADLKRFLDLEGLKQVEIEVDKKDAAVVFQPDGDVQMGQILRLSGAVVDLQDPDARGHGGVEPGPNLVKGQLVLAHQLVVENLADALHADAQGQGDGHHGPGRKALGVLQVQAAPLEGPLEQPHQVQVRNVDRISGLLKQNSMHRT